MKKASKAKAAKKVSKVKKIKPVAKKKAVKKPAAGKVAVKKPAAVKSKKAAVKRVPAAAKAMAGKSKAVEVPRIKLTAKTEQEFKDMLIAMRQRLTGQIAALQDDSLQRQDAVNSEEDGTDAFERQFALNIASSENEVVFEIDEALQRISQKAYGVCEQCGGGIEEARLKALPFVRMCIRCKTENEKGVRRFRPTP